MLNVSLLKIGHFRICAVEKQRHQRKFFILLLFFLGILVIEPHSFTFYDPWRLDLLRFSHWGIRVLTRHPIRTGRMCSERSFCLAFQSLGELMDCLEQAPVSLAFLSLVCNQPSVPNYSLTSKPKSFPALIFLQTRVNHSPVCVTFLKGPESKGWRYSILKILSIISECMVERNPFFSRGLCLWRGGRCFCVTMT